MVTGSVVTDMVSLFPLATSELKVTLWSPSLHILMVIPYVSMQLSRMHFFEVTLAEMSPHGHTFLFSMVSVGDLAVHPLP